MAMTQRRLIAATWLPNAERWPGIAAKLGQQAQAARRAGLDMEIVAVCQPGAVLPSGVRIAEARADVFARSCTRLAAIVRALALHPDEQLLLRYPGADDLSWSWFVDRLGQRTVTEHHTNRMGELTVLAQRPLARLRMGLERLWGPRLLGGTAGLIGVTEEIRAAECRRSARHLPSVTISNGIEIDSVPATGHRRLTNGPFELVFAAAEFFPWHGLDRLLAALASWRGPPTVIVHVLGRITATADVERIQHLVSDPHPHRQIIAHGFMTTAAADAVYSACHLGISTLALRRNGMRQACPLKSREYAARGLPFAYAYDDPDLPGDAPWFVRLPDEGPLDLQLLVESAMRICTGDGAPLRRFAAQRLSWESKLRNSVDFVRQVVG